MSKSFINGRSAVHKGDGKTNVSAPPDVCKTPSPGGPIPVPYVNVSQDSDLAAGSTSVFISGNSIALKDSHLSTSTGDEAGTAGGGLISAKTKGKTTWGSYSLDVKVEGKGVVRFLDVTQHNGNTFNTAFKQQGGTGLAYGDDPVKGSTQCPNCSEPKAEHRIHETPIALKHSRELLRELLRVAEELPIEDVLKVAVEEDGTDTFRGYMLGVLLCKCGDGSKIYAAMSGSYYTTAFTKAVEQLAAKDGRWTLCQPLSEKDFITNPRGDEIALSSFRKKKIGKNKPGVCAAPQLLQGAQRSGHIPQSMSEVWFRPRIWKRFRQGSQTVTVEHERNGKLVKRSFRHRESVPSCDTCKVVVTEMLCDVNKKKC